MASDRDQSRLADQTVSAGEIFCRVYLRRELSQTLSTNQMRRLRELLVQMRGPIVLIEDRALVSAIHLGDEELAYLRESINHNQATLACFRKRLRRQWIAPLSNVETPQDREKEVNALCVAIRAVEKERDEELLSSLKPEQKALWMSVCGKPLPIQWPLEHGGDDPFGG